MSIATTTRRIAFACSLLLATSIAHAGASKTPEFDFEPGKTSVDVLWRDFLARADFAAVMGAYDPVQAVQGEDGEPIAEKCAEQAEAFDRAQRVNPVGASVWYWAYRCAAKTGDTERERHAFAGFEAIVAHALAGYSKTPWPADIRTVAELDVDAILRATGHEVVYAYYDTLARTRLPMRVALWDADAKRELVMTFEFVDTWVQLNRAVPYARYPAFAMAVVSGYVRQSAESEGSIGQAAWRLANVSSAGEREQRVAALEALAREGQFVAAIGLATVCFRDAALNCGERVVDVLLPYAESGNAHAYLMLARAYAEGYGVKKDKKNARKLIESAAARLSPGEAYVVYAATSMMTRQGRVDPLVEREIRKLARAGDLRAEQFVGMLGTQDGIKQLSREPLAALQRTAEAGSLDSQRLLGDYLLSVGDAAGLRWLRKAAEGGDAKAQRVLADAYEKGEHVAHDLDLAHDWYARAAHGGDGDAAVVLARHWRDTYQRHATFRSGGTVSMPKPKAARTVGDVLQALTEVDPDAARHAAGWMQTAVMFGKNEFKRDLGMLWLTEPESEDAAPADGAAVLREHIAETDDHDARLLLATHLLEGTTIEKNPADARTLLLEAANKGHVPSQVKLGRWTLSGFFGDGVAPSEGETWLRKAIAKGDHNAQDWLATHMLYGNGIKADPASAIALWQDAADKGHVISLNNLVWMSCASLVEAARDPARGKAAAAKLRAATKEWTATDSVAACHAANGEFAEAVALQGEALAAANKAGAPDAAIARLRKRLEGYRANRAYVETEAPKFGL